MTASPTGAGELFEAGAAADVLRTMLSIRRFEEAVLDRFNAGEIAGTTHTYIGQEAVATGICAVLGDEDLLTSTHRGHGHLIAKGADLGAMMAELYGRTAGTNRGRGGSMHITDVSRGILGANGLVGAGVPHAVGAVWAKRLAGSEAVGIAFFGDGGINQGVVYEAMNMASVWRVPVIFVCENNQYALTTPAASMSATPIYERASTLGFPSRQVDGMRVEAVAEAAAGAIAEARASGTPTFLECSTYRFEGHMGAEKVLGLKYRSDEEMAEWVARDPIEHWVREAGIGATVRERVEREAAAAVEAAVELARAAPEPELDSALDYAYADQRTAALIRAGVRR